MNKQHKLYGVTSSKLLTDVKHRTASTLRNTNLIQLRLFKPLGQMCCFLHSSKQGDIKAAPRSAHTRVLLCSCYFEV